MRPQLEVELSQAVFVEQQPWGQTSGVVIFQSPEQRRTRHGASREQMLHEILPSIENWPERRFLTGFVRIVNSDGRTDRRVPLLPRLKA